MRVGDATSRVIRDALSAAPVWREDVQVALGQFASIAAELRQ